MNHAKRFTIHMHATPRRAAAYALTLLLLALCLGGCASYAPEQTVEAYYAYLQAGDYAGAYALLSPASQQSIDEATFIARHQNIHSELGTFDFSLGGIDCTGESPNVQAAYTLTYHTEHCGDLTYKFTMPLLDDEERYAIEWTPALIFPQLDWGDTVRINRPKCTRGDIFAGDTLIATTVRGVSVFVDPEKTDDLTICASDLAHALDLDPAKLLVTLEKAGSSLSIVKNYELSTLDPSLEAKLLEIPGVGIDYGNYYTYRQYPLGEYFFHITGYTGGITQEELDNLSPDEAAYYNADSTIGKSGLEAVHERTLRGIDGYQVYILNQEGGRKGEPIYSLDAQNGLDVHLTMDVSLQKRALDLLDLMLTGSETGVVIVMNPKTGAVESLVNYPSFDPNRFIGGISHDDWAYVTSEANGSPLFNKALQGLYPPGSTFKPFTASFALTAGAISTESVFPYPSQIKDNRWTPSRSDWFYPAITRIRNPSGKCDFTNAMIWSDNIFFAWAAMEMGADTFSQSAERLGIGEAIPFDLSVARSRLLNEGTEYNIKLLADSGYGQGEMLLTPLQLASSFGAFVNEGTIMQPHIVSGIYRAEKTRYTQVESTEPTVYKQEALEPYTVSKILPLLRSVVTDGTAKKLRPHTVAGKTGTAEIGNDKAREISWIVAFDYEQPRDSLVLVMLDVPANSGDRKLSIARGLFDALAERSGSPTAPEPTEPDEQDEPDPQEDESGQPDEQDEPDEE